MRPLTLLALMSLPALWFGCSDDEKAKPDPAADPCVPARTGEVIPEPALHTPRWAFEPWISKDISDGPDTYAFVQGFADRDIPVGAVVLDSPWETQYNTFVPNPNRYPDFAQMVDDLHAQDIRVVVWVTQMVNSASFDLEDGGDVYPTPPAIFEEGQSCSYFVDDGAIYGWWKGTGCGVDFFNPAAVAWWHTLQDPLFAMGLDGYKLDFGESYLRSDPLMTHDGAVSHQAYSEAYYRDFLSYGVHARGPEFVTMVRAYDKSYEFEGRFFARPEHAPVAWMGDNRRDWVGLADALDHMFRSAEAGYVVLGSDIGGYLDRDDKDLLGPEIPLDPDNFARWTALGALTPFMQLHGRANLAPWTVPQADNAIVDLYRYWAKLHHALVPFFYSLAERAYAGGPNLMRPIGGEAEWPSDYRYQLGDAFLVAPILDGTGVRDVALPAGTRWFDWWDPAGPALEGGQTLAYAGAIDIARIPLFVREGAIVPLAVEDAENGLGTLASAGSLSVLVFPSAEGSSFELYEDVGGEDSITTIAASVAAGASTVTLSRALRTTLLRVRVAAAPTTVTIAGAAAGDLVAQSALDAATSGYFYEDATQSVWVKLSESAEEVTVQIK